MILNVSGGGNANLIDFNTVLQTVTYNNTSASVDKTDRKVSFQVTDDFFIEGNIAAAVVDMGCTSAISLSTPIAGAVNGTGIDLTWAFTGTSSSIEVHRHTAPYFTPSSSTLLTTLAITATSYTDTTTVNASTQYYYEISGIGTDCNEPVNSGEIGRFTYSFSPAATTTTKHFAMALPLINPSLTTANAVATAIDSSGKVKNVFKFNPQTKSFVEYMPGISQGGDNFSVSVGDGLTVELKNGHPPQFTLVGKVPNSESFDFEVMAGDGVGGAGFAQISTPLWVDLNNIKLADTMAKHIQGESSMKIFVVYKFNPVTASFIQRVVDSQFGLPNFEIELGQPYLIGNEGQAGTAF